MGRPRKYPQQDDSKDESVESAEESQPVVDSVETVSGSVIGHAEEIKP